MTSLTVNGSTHQFEADPDKPLLWVLRDQPGLKGTKYGCGVGGPGVPPSGQPGRDGAGGALALRWS
jgi:xanthine dehydrogenase iron-sulfur cluster and FAD-binding subunit A